MGGRGSGSSLAPKSALDSKAQVTTIETYYRRSGRYYGVDVLTAKETSPGEISFDYAKPEFSDDNNYKSNTQDVTFKITHGAAKRNNTINFYGIDFSRVNSVSGQTYNLRPELVKRGFTWDGREKKWVRKK